MLKISICFFTIVLFSCNNANNKNDSDYHEGKILYGTKCSSCHPFLTMEGLHQTSLDQMRQLPFKDLFAKVVAIQSDTNHVKPPLNIDSIREFDIEKIVIYIKGTGEPKP